MATIGLARVREAQPEPRAKEDIVKPPKMQAKGVNVWYGEAHAIKDAEMDILEDEVSALIGPSGCGKSTLIRCFNRMNDTIPGCRVSGDIWLDGEPIYGEAVDVVHLRARVGMVFQKPNPFPKSVYDNVAYGPRIHGLARKGQQMDEIVQRSLERAGLWEEVKDRLDEPGTSLEVILMDEPCSALDPIATARIEELITELRGRYAIAIVTHNMQQAARVSQRTAFFHLGELVEYGPTEEIFTNPRKERTRDYITGRYG